MNTEDLSEIDFLKKKVADQQRLIIEKDRRLDECAEEYRNMCSLQIAQLRAVQMLYDVMAAGHTHNQKRVFAEVAKETLSREIGNLIDKHSASKWKFSDHKDLPF